MSAADTLREKYGDDYFSRIGKSGGKSTHKRHFAINTDQAKLGGYKSKRGYTFLGDIDGEKGKYKSKSSGKTVVLEYKSRRTNGEISKSK